MKRILRFQADKSYLLLGPRQTGKSTLVKSVLGENDLLINLLQTATFLELSKDPGRFHDGTISSKALASAS